MDENVIINLENENKSKSKKKKSFKADILPKETIEEINTLVNIINPKKNNKHMPYSIVKVVFELCHLNSSIRKHVSENSIFSNDFFMDLFTNKYSADHFKNAEIGNNMKPTAEKFYEIFKKYKESYIEFFEKNEEDYPLFINYFDNINKIDRIENVFEFLDNHVMIYRNNKLCKKDNNTRNNIQNKNKVKRTNEVINLSKKMSSTTLEKNFSIRKCSSNIFESSGKKSDSIKSHYTNSENSIISEIEFDTTFIVNQFSTPKARNKNVIELDNDVFNESASVKHLYSKSINKTQLDKRNEEDEIKNALNNLTKHLHTLFPKYDENKILETIFQCSGDIELIIFCLIKDNFYLCWTESEDLVLTKYHDKNNKEMENLKKFKTDKQIERRKKFLNI